MIKKNGRGQHPKNTGRKKCHECRKFFPKDELEAHIKVHKTEEHLNNLAQGPAQAPEMLDADEAIIHQRRLEQKARVYRDVLYDLCGLLQQVLSLEREY